MFNIDRQSYCALIVLTVGLMSLGMATARAQTAESPLVAPASPPAYISELLKAGDLTQEQVDLMRTAGYGWGEVRLAVLLAQQVAANSSGSLTFADALAQVMAARADGKGFGEIAADNNLKIGGLVGNRKGAADAQQGSAAQRGRRTQAGEADGDEEVTPDPANPPAFIREMVRAQVVTQEQMNTMLTAGYGWGEVRIAALMAQQMVANSNGTLTFAGALAQIMAARAAGKDFGQIATENNMKVGDLVGKKGVGKSQGDSATRAGTGTPNAKRPGFFARLGRALGFGRSANKAESPVGVTRNLQEGAPKAVQGDQPETPVRVERAVRADRPERPETPARLERPERPERPGRPERLEKGFQKGS